MNLISFQNRVKSLKCVAESAALPDRGDTREVTPTTATLSAGAVARQLGVSPATLRTWAHRYGLEPSARSEGSHRRYTPADVDRLLAMQRLIRSGVPVSDAAAQVLAGELGAATDTSEAGREVGRGAARSLWEAALALDGQRCAAIISSSVSESGVLQTWNEVVVPALRRAGDQWEQKNSGIEVEHVLSDAVVAGLASDRPVRRDGVLLAATADEDHVLGLHALRAALAEQGIGSEVLTARTPPVALGDAARRLHPAVIILWAQMPMNADPKGFAHLPGLRPKPALAVAGPGWSRDSNVVHLADLRDAVNFVRSHI